MKIDIKMLTFKCQKCGKERNNVKVGSTSKGNVCIIWNCLSCKKDILILIPLDYFQNLDSEEEDHKPNQGQENNELGDASDNLSLSKKDLRFLRSLKIKPE